MFVRLELGSSTGPQRTLATLIVPWQVGARPLGPLRLSDHIVCCVGQYPSPCARLRSGVSIAFRWKMYSILTLSTPIGTSIRRPPLGYWNRLSEARSAANDRAASSSSRLAEPNPLGRGLATLSLGGASRPNRSDYRGAPTESEYQSITANIRPHFLITWTFRN